MSLGLKTNITHDDIFFIKKTIFRRSASCFPRVRWYSLSSLTSIQQPSTVSYRRSSSVPRIEPTLSLLVPLNECFPSLTWPLPSPRIRPINAVLPPSLTHSGSATAARAPKCTNCSCVGACPIMGSYWAQ